MVMFTRLKKDVPEAEKRNWPKGATQSSHEFKDSATKPGTSRSYLNNEQCFAIYKELKKQLIAERNLSPNEADLQAKIAFLLSLYPNDDLANFRSNNADMPDKCCRLIFSIDLSRIANVHLVHGEAIKLFQLAVAGDEELNEPDDPKWGWQMDKPEEGFPCMNLTQDGCNLHASNGKPKRCIAFPYFESDIQLIDTCSYKFNPQGQRQGICNRCGVI